jgi:hypothetical protein
MEHESLTASEESYDGDDDGYEDAVCHICIHFAFSLTHPLQVVETLNASYVVDYC